MKKLSDVRCFVLDMDGTICLGETLFPYTNDFLARVERSSRRYVFYTNNSSRSKASTLEKLRRLGIDTVPDNLIISTEVLLSHLSERHKDESLYVVGTDDLLSDFSGWRLDDTSPDVVIIGFDTSLTYEKLNKACRFIRNGTPVYGINTDLNCPVEGGFIPDCGSICAFITASTGVNIECFGKPSRRTLDYIVRATGFSESGLCFVGDRLYTDIAVARGTGAMSLLVLSGETKLGNLDRSDVQPDMVFNDLSEVLVE